MERWQLRGTRAVAARAGQDTAEIDEAIAERERELTRAGSRDERMRALASRLGLSAADVDLLWWVVAAATEPAVLRTAEPLGGTRARRGGSLAMFAEVVELPERSFNAITAVSGSGPAYVFFLVQAWEAAARALGLPRATAARAIRSTLAGSARLLGVSADPAAVLVRRVASKKGTTEAALRVLAKRRVAAAFLEALQAAACRSKELSGRPAIGGMSRLSSPVGSAHPEESG